MNTLRLNFACITKLRAMQASILKRKELLYLENSEDIKDLMYKLEHFNSYSSVFSKTNSENLHRNEIERLLYNKLLKSFNHLYDFVIGDDRKFLKLYFVHFEVSMLKRFLRRIKNNKNSLDIWQDYEKYFSKHSSIDFLKLAKCDTLNDFLDNLNKTPYHKAISNLDKSNNFFDFELALDFFYFKKMSTGIKNLSNKNNILILETIIGTRIDLLNIQWIYRSKKYYHLTGGFENIKNASFKNDFNEIYKLLIPNYYKIDKTDIKNLITSSSIDEFINIFKSFYYYKNINKNNLEIFNIEMISNQIIYNTFIKLKKTYKTSLIFLYTYLFNLEYEIESIIKIIESVRYNVSDSILSENLFLK